MKNRQLRAAVNRATHRMFTDGMKRPARRLVMEFDGIGIDGTGWSLLPFADALYHHLRDELIPTKPVKRRRKSA